jgi:ATP-dependent protease ClpP protease subunit
MKYLVPLIFLLIYNVNASKYEVLRDVTKIEHTKPSVNGASEQVIGDTLYIDGEIHERLAPELEYGDYKNVKRIVLNSYGGLVTAGIEIAKLIRSKQLDTILPAGGVCMSACTLLFQAGVNREAHKTSIFMYHAPRLSAIGMIGYHYRCKKYGQKSCDEFLNDRIRNSEQETFDFFAVYEVYGFSSSFYEEYRAMSDEPYSDWFPRGNTFKKPDVFVSYIARKNILVHDKPLRASAIHWNLNDRESFDMFNEMNVVTKWYANKVDWKTSFEVEQGSFPLP